MKNKRIIIKREFLISQELVSQTNPSREALCEGLARECGIIRTRNSPIIYCYSNKCMMLARVIACCYVVAKIIEAL